MTAPRVFISDVGILCPAGSGRAPLREALLSSSRLLSKLTLLDVAEAHDRPVGEVRLGDAGDASLPRCHRLALSAIEQLRLQDAPPVEWICLGTTTGGMDRTEVLLADGVTDPDDYRNHGLDTVAGSLAEALGHRVRALTFSTACSSGAVALHAGAELIRSGRARCVLAGGVDALCRLTTHGFSLLQIVDPEGARPLDAGRRGMTVAEGATLFLLVAGDEPPPGSLAELCGGGLSCDAHDATAPDPEGRGARRAMERALAQAGIDPAEVGYLNLHGTGTPDNDAAEAKAVRSVFGDEPPPLSSTKGAFGHALAASGALEAAVAVEALEQGLVPANTGLGELDETLGIRPCTSPEQRPVATVLSNSLGFGGNNASLVLGRVDRESAPRPSAGTAQPRLSVIAAACLTGAGDTDRTLAALAADGRCAGRLPDAELGERFKGREFRRMRRLPRLAQWVCRDVLDAGDGERRELDGVYWATGWGALTESHRFLHKLRASDGVFSSPIDFSASVHNAAAGQLAIRFGARGPNLTLCGGRGSFWQAAVAAGLLADPGPQLLVAGDEHHDVFTPLFQPGAEASPADGAAALIVSTAEAPGPYLEPLVPPTGDSPEPDPLTGIIEAYGGRDAMRERVGALWLGVPAREASVAQRQAERLIELVGDAVRVELFRDRVGDFPTATAVAAVLAVRALADAPPTTDRRPHLVLELGDDLWGLEVGWR